MSIKSRRELHDGRRRRSLKGCLRWRPVGRHHLESDRWPAALGRHAKRPLFGCVCVWSVIKLSAGEAVYFVASPISRTDGHQRFVVSIYSEYIYNVIFKRLSKRQRPSLPLLRSLLIVRVRVGQTRRSDFEYRRCSMWRSIPSGDGRTNWQANTIWNIVN